jgi:hypothetical protein
LGTPFNRLSKQAKLPVMNRLYHGKKNARQLPGISKTIWMNFIV